MKTSALTVALVVALAVGPVHSRGGSAASTTPDWLVPNVVAFWDKEHGLIGTGSERLIGMSDQECRTGKCHPGSISVTTDGGRTSRVLVRTRGPVTWLAVAPEGQAWAVVPTCEQHGCSRRLWHSADAGATWRVVGPARFQAASFADAEHGFGIASPQTTAAGGLEPRLIVTDDGGRSWHQVRSPCSGTAQGISLATATRGWLLCVLVYGVGNAGKTIYRTDDGGKHWQRVADTRLVTSGVRQHAISSGGIAFYGYPEGIAFAPDGIGVLWESRGTLYLTGDGGKNWKSFMNVSLPEEDFGLSAAATRGRAFALLTRAVVRPVPFRLVATTQDFSGWRTVRTWTSSIR